MSICLPIRIVQKWKFSTEEVLNAVLDSTEEYIDDSDYQYSDFESECDTDMGNPYSSGGQSSKG